MSCIVALFISLLLCFVFLLHQARKSSFPLMPTFVGQLLNFIPSHFIKDLFKVPVLLEVGHMFGSHLRAAFGLRVSTLLFRWLEKVGVGGRSSSPAGSGFMHVHNLMILVSSAM